MDGARRGVKEDLGTLSYFWSEVSPMCYLHSQFVDSILIFIMKDGAGTPQDGPVFHLLRTS